MAEGKKSFVAYADWKETFDSLPDEVAGKLIKHIFAYVNDENPKSDDYVINSIFINIRNTLKRDLEKWERQLEQRREAGKRSAEQRATKFNERSNSLNETERNSTDNCNMLDVSVSESVLLKKETKSIFSFEKSLIEFGAEKQLAKDWISTRNKKKLAPTKTALDDFLNEVSKSGKNINDVLKKCCASGWGGFKASWDWKENNNQQNLLNGNQQTTTTGKERFRDVFSNLANEHQQTQVSNPERELFEDSEYIDVTGS